MKKKIVFLLMIITTYIPSVYAATCPLGKDVTKDLAEILHIIQIIGPLLVIVVTIIEVAKSISKKEIQNESKKLFTRLIKRVIYCLLLFFVPVIVETGAKIAQIDVSSCDLSNPTDNNYKVNTTSKKTLSTTTTTTTKRSSSGGGTVVTPSGNAKYYYNEMESPDSKSDYTIEYSGDSNYKSYAVSVSSSEKQWIINAICGEMGACKAGAVATAQVIRDTYLYLGEYDSRFNSLQHVIDQAFSSGYRSGANNCSNGVFAFDYVFNQGNSFYPAKLFGQRGIVSGYAGLSPGEKSLSYIIVFKLKTHYDRGTTKQYITDPIYATGYEIGNSKLESSSYINSSAKVTLNG